jgi:hypothetical protein
LEQNSNKNMLANHLTPKHSQPSLGTESRGFIPVSVFSQLRWKASWWDLQCLSVFDVCSHICKQ